MSAHLALLLAQPAPAPEAPPAGSSSALSLLALVAVVVLALIAAHLFQKLRRLIGAWRGRIGNAALIAPPLPLAAWWLGLPVPGWLVLVATAAAGLMVWRKWGRASAVVSRLGESNRRKMGVASPMDIRRAASGRQLRKKARVLRPTYTAQMSNRQLLLHTPLKQFGDPIARVGFMRVWHACEDFGIVVGGPRTGKSQWLVNVILDAPGALLVTSTRTDLLDQTGPMRARTNGPVYVFNAGGVGERPSTITLDPLVGCENPVTAVERAADLLAPGAGDEGGDRKFWNDQARRILAAMLHAAALNGEHTMDDVARWVADPKGCEKEMLWELRSSPMSTGYGSEIRQFVNTNDRTRSSITSTMMPALAWLTAPAARDAARRGASIDVEKLLRDRATIYLIGTKDGTASALVSALTGYIAREARRLAAMMPGGRLDPNLTLVLDEAALLAPPLEDWTADMGGRNVTIWASFQSRAQLLSRWNEHQAAEIFNNAATMIVFGGTNDRDDLQWWSTRAGDRDEPIQVKDDVGGVKTQTVRSAPVLAPAQLANLPVGKVVIFRRGMPPVVATAPMGHRRRDVRRHQERLFTQRLARLFAGLRRQPASVWDQPIPAWWGDVPEPRPAETVPDDERTRV